MINMRRSARAILFMFMFVAGAFAFACKQANASLMITPTTIVFEGRDRTAEIVLVNTGNIERKYKLSFVYHKMLPETGAYKLLKKLDEGEFDLSKYIDFRPRQVRLAPGAKQKIRLALRRPAQIPEGDFHAHLKFESVPVKEDVKQVRSKSLEDNKASASVTINVNYTIPVILREGRPDAVVEIGQVRFERNKVSGLLDAIIPVTRSAQSPYAILGYLNVYHKAANGDEGEIGELFNVNIFPEIDTRTFKIPLKKDITGGSVHFVLKNYDRESDFIYAEKMFALE